MAVIELEIEQASGLREAVSTVLDRSPDPSEVARIILAETSDEDLAAWLWEERFQLVKGVAAFSRRMRRGLTLVSDSPQRANATPGTRERVGTPVRTTPRTLGGPAASICSVPAPFLMDKLIGDLMLTDVEHIVEQYRGLVGRNQAKVEVWETVAFMLVEHGCASIASLEAAGVALPDSL